MPSDRDSRLLLIALLIVSVTGRSVVPEPNVHANRTAGQFQIHVLQVGQGDSQLIVFPSGYTVLNDVAELNWNTCKGAEYVAEKVVEITGSKHVDVGVISHWHVDHLGYAGYGGFWCLIERDLLTFGKIVDRDGGVWQSGTECNENTITWKNVGTVGGTAINWVCYFSDANSKIHGIREVAVLGSSTQISPPDGDGEVSIIITDALGVKMADGITDVSGDHHKDNVPPSENDYCIGLLIRFGDFTYVTAGDLDGEYATSGFGYTYNDAESVAAMSNSVSLGVDVVHANHHGSGHSSNTAYINTLAPQATLISCGYDNSHGHPAQAVLDRLLSKGDVFLTNVCALDRDYGRSVFVNGEIVLTSNDGRSFRISGLEREYISKRAFTRLPLR